jgi:FkbM family methyltransferase
LEDYSVVKDIYKQLFVGEPKLIIDLGANIGLTSVYFSKSYDAAVIHAVEPFEDNAAMAKLNMQRNHVKDFRVIKGGIWSHNCMLSLDKEFRDGKEWSIRLVEDTGGNIRGICLDEMLSSYQQPIDILKMDIEGAEKRLFADPIYAGAFLKRVKCLAIEIHDEFDCRQIIYDALAGNGFFYYEVKDMTIAINKNYL